MPRVIEVRVMADRMTPATLFDRLRLPTMLRLRTAPVDMASPSEAKLCPFHHSPVDMICKDYLRFSTK